MNIVLFNPVHYFANYQSNQALVKLKELIDKLVLFGIKSDVESVDKTREVKQLLIGIYNEYLNLPLEIAHGDSSYKTLDTDYDKIRNNISSNFPEFGWYHQVLESHKIFNDADLVTGDAIDDLSDIVQDMLRVKSLFENNNEESAIWYFDFIMRAHSEQHLVNFLKFLNDLEGE